jgi:hypothetical protein
VGATSAAFAGVVDSTTNVSCLFGSGSDDVVRCLPAMFYPDSYADRYCTQPLLQVAHGTSPPAAATPYDGTNPDTFCTFEHREHLVPESVGARYTGSIWQGSTGCLSVKAASGQDYYQLDPMPLTDLVAVDEVRDPRGGNLEMRFLASDDGGLFPLGGRDSSLGTACSAEYEVFPGLCVPSDPMASAGYVDSACASQLLYAAPPCDPDEKTFWGGGTRCGRSFVTGVFDPFPVTVSGNMLYDYTPSTGCTPFPPFDPPAPTFFTKGAPIASTTFPAVTLNPVGAGRLHPAFYSTAAGDLLELQFQPGESPTPTDPSIGSYFGLDHLYDTTLGTLCMPLASGAAGLRCVPTGSLEWDLGDTGATGVTYADASCMTPLFAFARTYQDSTPTPQSCAPYLPRFIAVHSADGTRQVFAVTEKTTLQTAYMKYSTDPTCRSVAAPPGGFGDDIYDLTPILDTDLPALEYVVE